MLAITSRKIRSHLPLFLGASLLIVIAPAARASDISYVDTYRNISYEQTGNGNALSLNGTFFSAELNATTPNAYTSVSVALPGGSSIALTQTSPGDYTFQTALLPDQATMDAMFPTGTYTFTGMNGSQTDTATLNYSADDYSQTVPFLTGDNYSDLQGMNAAENFTFDLSPFTPGGSQTDAYIFLTVFDQATGDVAFTDGFLDPSTTSITMGAGELDPGTSYSYEIDYSDRDIPSDTGGAQFPPQLGFDVRTDGTFTTAAVAATPEPSSVALLGTGLLVGIAGIRRRIA